jgi:hypothetical protein
VVEGFVSPADELARRRAARQEAADRERARSERLGSLRLLAAAAWIPLGVLVLGTRDLAGEWLLLPLVPFVALLVLHQRCRRRRERALRAVAFHEQGLARLEDRWPGTGNDGARFEDAGHPYASDLDLFGTGSLFEHLCLARTLSGEATLARWLGEPAAPAEVAARQEAVRELAPRLDLREDVALLGEDVRVGIHGDELATWGAGAPKLPAGAAARIAAALSVAAVVGLGLAVAGLGLRWLLPVLLAEVVLALVFLRRVNAVLGDADRPARELDLLARLLARIEREPATSPLLLRLREGLRSEGEPPSRCVARLRRLLQMADARRNQIFIVPSLLLMWGTQVAFAIERWRRRHGPEVGRWLAATGTFEALSSLAGHTYERPDHVFPEVVEGEPRLEGEAVGHPLLPAASCVRNDLRIGGACRLHVVSGSNMSGKTTWLRTIGVNAVLAQAGGPVRARSFRMTPLRIATSMRTQDSLLDGRSRFYAEIERLRLVVGLAEGDLPALFLLDELLAGTNSHDRAIGAEAIVRGLLERGATGLVTTHDLSLAGVADALEERARNVHFEDRLDGDRVVFDYRLRDGVVTRSNALDLMRAVGLEV